MPIRPTVGRLVLIAMRHLEAEARHEAMTGKRTDLGLKWLQWLLDDKHLAGTKTTWPMLGQEELYEQLVELRDVKGLSFGTIGEILGRDRSTLGKMYRSFKEWIETL